MISWLEKNRRVSWIITIIIFGLIFYISSLSFPPTIVGPATITSAAYHIGIFFLLAIFFFISVLNREWNWKKIILSILIVSIYAVLDEFHQFFVPGRFCSTNDFLLDFTGIIFASLLYFILIEKRRNKYNLI